MIKIHRIRRNETVIYIALWIAILLVVTLHIMTENSSRGNPVFSVLDATNLLGIILPLFCLFAINNYLLIPRLLLRQRELLYAIVATTLVTGIAIWLYSWNHPPELPRVWTPDFQGADIANYGRPRPPFRNPAFMPMPLIHNFIFAALVVGVNLAIALVSRQIILNFERERLMAANVANQLEQLKTQINPHFYMNMLNNIHGLVDINPEKAKETIMDMSRLMQYMLYDSSKDVLPLSSEIAFLQDYLRVMRRRYARTKVKIQTDFPLSESVSQIKVPPLLFLVFIENAFKHGVDYRSDSFVAISLKVDDTGVYFECMNSVPSAKSQQLRRGGLGLENIKKRLALIYGDKARLEICETKDKFFISLHLPFYETANLDNR